VIIECKDKCVLRIKKLHKKDLRKASSHNLRKIKVANADGTKTILPLKVKPNDNDLTSNLHQVALKKLRDHGIRSIATNAICGIELVLSVSNGFFNDDIMKSFDIELNVNKHRLADWTNMTASWLRNMFGDNLLQMQLHLDETTPHIHAVVLPLVEKPIIQGTGLRKGESVLKWRLCGSDVLRKSWYFHMQTEYSKAVEVLGLERGVQGSKAEYKDLRKLEALQKELESTKHKNNEVQQKLASYEAELEMMRNEIMDENQNYASLKQRVVDKKKTIDQLDGYRDEQQTEINNLESTKEQREADIENLKKAENVLSQSYKTLQHQCIYKEEELVQLDDYRDEQQTEINNLESTKKQREADIENLKKAENVMSQSYKTLQHQCIYKKEELVQFDDYRKEQQTEINNLESTKEQCEADIEMLQKIKQKLENQEFQKQFNEKFGSYLRTFKAMDSFAQLIMKKAEIVSEVCGGNKGLSQIGSKIRQAQEGMQETLRQHAGHLNGLNNAQASPSKLSNESRLGGHSMPEDDRYLKTRRNQP
jgi:hypothetical protein